jgi:hypothetical protein
MEKDKLTIIEIRYIRALAAVKTDEELAVMIEKPVDLIKAQFALMCGLPKRPDEPLPAVATASIAESKVKSAKLPKVPKKEKIRKGEKKSISHAERKVRREQKKAEEEKLKRDKQSLHAQEQDRIRERSKRATRSTFKTRTLDLSNTIRVQLNAKTTVWVKPGTDIDELKKKYKIA